MGTGLDWVGIRSRTSCILNSLSGLSPGDGCRPSF